MKKKIIVPTALLLIVSLFANTAVFAAPYHHPYQRPSHRMERMQPQPPHHHHRTPTHHKHHSHSKASTIVAASVLGALVIGAGIAAAVSD